LTFTDPPRDFLRIGAALVSACLLALSQPGFDVGPLSFVALVPWTLAALAGGGRGGWKGDLLLGLVFFGVTVGWLRHVSWIAAGIVIVVCSLLVVVTGACFRRMARVVPASIALPLAWTVGEFLRSVCPPGGFPYAYLGHGLYRTQPFPQVAALAGPYAVTFVAAAVNGALADGIAHALGLSRKGPRVRLVSFAIAGALFALPFLVPIPPSEGPPGPAVHVVQANIPQPAKKEAWADYSRGGDMRERMFYDHLRLTKSIADPGDLVVWAETMFPWNLGEGRAGEILDPATGVRAEDVRENERVAIREEVMGHLGRSETSFLVGAFYYGRRDGAFRLFNAALLFAPDGSRAGLYQKIHRVPGGEYLPWRESLPFVDAVGRWIEGWAGYLPDMAAGREPRVFRLRGRSGGDWRIGIAICYDNAYPDLFRQNALEGADFHLVLSNEAHFLDSFEMDHLLAQAVLRAIETRRPVLRATNSGISALVDATGRIVQVLEVDGRRKEVAGSLRFEVPPPGPLPPFARWGEFLSLASLGGSGLLLAIAGSRSRARVETRLRFRQ